MDFSDFTLEKYERLLDRVKVNYTSIFFQEIKFEEAGQFILRHDVDYSLEHALQLAELEAAREFKATYFIQSTCDFYNPFCERSIEIVKRIQTLGHDIGIHVDSHSLNLANRSLLEDWLEFETNLFFRYYKVKVSAFSFHNPNEELLSIGDHELKGLVNAYSKKISDKFSYCSDSNGYWRFDSIFKLLDSSPDCVQFLTHPAWWQNEILPPRRRIETYLEEQKKRIMKKYDSVLEASGRKNYK